MPKHQIPEDPKLKAEMGLPEEYCDDRVDIPIDYVRNFGDKSWKHGTKGEVDPEAEKIVQNLQKELERLTREVNDKNRQSAESNEEAFEPTKE